MKIRTDDGEPVDSGSEVGRLAALLEEERAMFRAEVEAGAAELAQQDELISRLTESRDSVIAQRDAARARMQLLKERRDNVAAQRDAARAKVREVRAHRDKVVAQRDVARAELGRYEESRVVRLAARTMDRLRRLRGLA